MANQTNGKQTKPKCGAGQSCGFACIEASRTCTEKLDGAISKAAVEALRSHATAALATVATESTDFRGRSFDEVQAKFSANDAKHTIASTVVDHGEGITTQKVTLVASDGSGDTLTHTLLRMAADGDQPERIFTLADGMAKEYTDAAKHNYWNESRDAAVRAAISLPADRPLVVAEPAPNQTADEPAPDAKLGPVQPYTVVKKLESGAVGIAELTDRGTVVKTELKHRNKSLGLTFDLEREAQLQQLAASLGVAPKVLAVDKEHIEQELAPGKSLADLTTNNWSPDTPESLKLVEKANASVGLSMMKLHSVGLVHNDLHGGNVLVDSDGSTKIIDYGASTKSGEENSPTPSQEFARRRKLYPGPEVTAMAARLKPLLRTEEKASQAAHKQEFGRKPKDFVDHEEKAQVVDDRDKAVAALETAYQAELSKLFASK